MGGKKKESKGMFGNKVAKNRPGHENVTKGAQLNQGLEDQFNRAYGFHHQGKNNRGFSN